MFIKFPNSRMSSIPMVGGIREILARANELEACGRQIFHLEIGRPDFDSPLCAKEAAQKALDMGDVHYTDMSGTSELRNEIAKKYSRENGMSVDPDKNIVVTAGAIEALSAALLCSLEPGDEVIVPAPYFPSYLPQITIAGGVIKEVPTSMENGFRLQVEDLEKAITDKTKYILLCTPNNPSGAVFTRDDLLAIADVAIAHNIGVISDEPYEKFLYEGKHISIGSLPGMSERTVTISAASKTWSMTGWRVGWAICPDEMKPYITKCHQNLSTCAASFAQAGVAEAFRSADKDVTVMVAEYKRRRDMVVNRLSLIDGVEILNPAGAFYVFPRITAFGMDGFKFCSYLLEESGVAGVPGEVFGMPGHIRFAYCRSFDYLEEAMDKVRLALDKLKG